MLAPARRSLPGSWARTWPKIALAVPSSPASSAALAVRASAADGYTLVQMDDAHMSVLGHLMAKIPYNTTRDFDPVASLFRTYFFVVVPVDSPWKTVGDIIAAAKAKNGSLSYGSWGIGSPGHIGMAVFEAATGVQMNHVPFKELPQLYQGVANNDVGWAFGTAASTGPMYCPDSPRCRPWAKRVVRRTSRSRAGSASSHPRARPRP